MEEAAERCHSEHARSLVRRYTDELEAQSERGEPIGTVAQSLVGERRESDIAEQQKLEFERLDRQQRSAISNHRREAFTAQSEKLKKAVEAFEQTLRSKDRVPRLNAQEYTIDDYVETVKAIEARRSSNKDVGFYEKSKSYMHRLCKGIDQHKTMLEMIPSGNYTSVFLGGMKTLVVASVNHEKIDKDLVQSLERINEVACACAKERELYPTIYMLNAFLDLYTLIFEFLHDAIQWYLKRSRFGLSFNEKFKDKFDNKVGEIEKKSNSIWREAQYGEGLRSQMVLEYLPKIEMVVKSQGEVQAGFHRQGQRIEEAIQHQGAEIQRQNQQIHLLGQSVKGLLLEQAEKNLRDQQSQPQPAIFVVNLTVQSSHVMTSESSENISGSTVMETSWNFEVLGKFFLEDRISPDLPTSSIFLERAIIVKVQQWTTSPSPQFLGIIGPAEFVETTAASTMAVTFLSLVQRVRIPCLSYFCKLSDPPDDSSHTRETKTMVAMLYALIWQLSKLVGEDPQRDSQVPTIHARLEKLDGSANSIPDAIALLGQLLLYAPLTTFCVIYGLHLLDDPSTTDHVKNLLQTFRDVHLHRVAKNPNMLLKVLFTISGRSEVLQRNLGDNELVRANHFRNARTPNRPGPGRRRLELDLTPITPSKDPTLE